LFEGGRWKRDEALEEVDAISVEAKVPVGGEAGCGVAAIGDGGTGEVEGVAEAVEGEFDDVGICDEIGIIEGAAGGDHGEGLVLAERAGEGVDEGGF